MNFGEKVTLYVELSQGLAMLQKSFETLKANFETAKLRATAVRLGPDDMDKIIEQRNVHDEAKIKLDAMEAKLADFTAGIVKDMEPIGKSKVYVRLPKNTSIGINSDTDIVFWAENGSLEWETQY